MLTWIKFFIEFLKMLPVLIPLIKQVIDAINGKNSDVKPAKAIVREKKKALREAMKRARVTGNNEELAKLMNTHLKLNK